MRRLWARAGVILGLAVLVAAAVWSFMPGPVPVDLARVTKGRFVATVDEDGKTRVRERYVVAAPIAGRLARLRLKVGDSVNVDDAVATILPPPAPMLDPRASREAENRVGAAEAEIARAKEVEARARSQAENAHAELARTRTLFERKTATAQALERAELVARVADREVAAAQFLEHAGEHILEQARALLARYRDSGDNPLDQWSVLSPVSGVVLRLDQESETIVQPGAPLVTIGDAADLEVVVDVLSVDAVEIKPGGEATIERWGGDAALIGRVRRVEPEAFTKISTLGVEEQRVNVLIDILSPPEQWAGLGDAYQVNARIVTFVKDDAVIAPVGALFRSGEQWFVFVDKAGRAERRRVDVLRRSGRLAAISAGLAPGERVIVFPSDRIAPGVRVAPR